MGLSLGLPFCACRESCEHLVPRAGLRHPGQPWAVQGGLSQAFRRLPLCYLLSHLSLTWVTI